MLHGAGGDAASERRAAPAEGAAQRAPPSAHARWRADNCALKHAPIVANHSRETLVGVGETVAVAHAGRPAGRPFVFLRAPLSATGGARGEVRAFPAVQPDWVWRSGPGVVGRTRSVCRVSLVHIGWVARRH